MDEDLGLGKGFSEGVLRVVLIYGVAAALWILFSDKAVEILFDDPAQIIQASMAKGWLFVAVTSLLLYALMRRLLAQIEAAYQREDAMKSEKLGALRLLASIADTSENAIAAHEHAEAAANALRESEACYRLIVESAAEGYWQIDDERRTTDVNDVLCRLLGYAREEMLGRRPTEFADEENQRIFRDQMARIGDTRHRYYEIVLRRKDGSPIPVYFQATTHFDEAGSVAFAFAFITDLTERKAAEEELRQRNEQLERFNRATVGRELDIIELKKQINALSKELGREPPFALAFLDQPPQGAAR